LHQQINAVALAAEYFLRFCFTNELFCFTCPVLIFIHTVFYGVVEERAPHFVRQTIRHVKACSRHFSDVHEWFFFNGQHLSNASNFNFSVFFLPDFVPLDGLEE
jgi:hypothetical protein